MREFRLSFTPLLLALLALGAAHAWADDDNEEKVPGQTEPKGEAAAAATKDDQYFELMRVFADTFEQIDRNYVKNVDRRKLIEAALRGMMEELDPYSNYISPEEQQRFTEQIEQEFVGIGIQVQPDPQSRRLTVTSPLPGTPAYKAGIAAGDVIMEIDGKTTEKMTVNDAVKILRGKEGQEVTLSVLHPGKPQIDPIKIVREKISVPTVLGDVHLVDGTWDYMLNSEQKIGYIRITGFSRNTDSELKKALRKLTEAGVKGLVLDLRYNPGGSLNSAIDICDEFIEEGKLIVSTKGRNTEERPFTTRRNPGRFKNPPMAVLVNRYSASASEIVSAALQDHKRAVVIGERTWGKGSVQNVIKLEEGKSQLKLTTASYHRPSGKNIHRFPDSKETDEWGVMPDEGYLVPNSPTENENYLDYRRARDVASKEGPPKSEYQDKQLAKAIEYLMSKISPEKKPEAEAKPDAKPDAKAESKPEAGKTSAVKPVRPVSPFGQAS